MAAEAGAAGHAWRRPCRALEEAVEEAEVALPTCLAAMEVAAADAVLLRASEVEAEEVEARLRAEEEVEVVEAELILVQAAVVAAWQL